MGNKLLQSKTSYVSELAALDAEFLYYFCCSIDDQRFGTEDRFGDGDSQRPSILPLRGDRWYFGVIYRKLDMFEILLLFSDKAYELSRGTYILFRLRISSPQAYSHLEPQRWRLVPVFDLGHGRWLARRGPEARAAASAQSRLSHSIVDFISSPGIFRAQRYRLVCVGSPMRNGCPCYERP